MWKTWTLSLLILHNYMTVSSHSSDKGANSCSRKGFHISFLNSDSVWPGYCWKSFFTVTSIWIMLIYQNEYWIRVCPGVANRQWKVEIVEDHLEESEEMFEVTLDSPVGAIQRGSTKAVITLMDSMNGNIKVFRGYDLTSTLTAVVTTWIAN